MADEADERARRREERRKRREAEKSAESNGPPEEEAAAQEQADEEEKQRQEEADRKRQEEEAERQRQEEQERQAQEHDEEEHKRQEEEEKKKKEAAAKQAAAPKKKLGGLSTLRRLDIKKQMMKKAQENLQQEAADRAAEKSKFIKDNLNQIDDIEYKDKDELVDLVKRLHEKLHKFESEKYDLQMVIRKNDLAIEDLKSRVNEARGKFVKPTLKKVVRTDKFADDKVAEKKGIDVQLKRVERKSASEGLDVSEGDDKVDLRAQLKKVEK